MKTPSLPAARATRVPLWLKLAYTAFMAVLIPVYWHHYGPANFLYFCDVALFLTLAGIWRESARWVSLAAVGILIPQLLWCVDFACEWAGARFTGMTSYMFDGRKPLFLRALSLFHGWLPWLLLFLVARLGYDRRAFRDWSLLAAVLCVFCYLFLPPAGAELPDPNLPRNVNYVFGMDDASPQTWLPAPAYLGVWITGLVLLIYLPTHLLLKRQFACAA